jgi:hypothetical protein
MPASSDWGHDLPVRQRRALVSSTPIAAEVVALQELPGRAKFEKFDDHRRPSAHTREVANGVRGACHNAAHLEKVARNVLIR